MDALSAMQTVRSSNGQSAARWPFQLPPDSCQRLAKSLKKHWKRYRKALKRCQGHFGRGSVHDLRVETRRLLSLFDLLSPFLPKRPLKEVRCAFKQRLDIFDELRDTQVQLGILGKTIPPRTASAAFEKFLCKREKRLTRSTRRKLKRTKNKRLKKLITSSKNNVLTCAKRHSPSQANARLLRCVASALARTLHLREQIDSADTRTIHRTRVAFKHYRYMIEALAGLCPPADKKLKAALHDYQTLMGNIQDAEVLIQAWRKFQCKARLAPQLAQEFNGQLLLFRQAAIDAYLRADRHRFR